jgi:hypothetical protein
MKLESFVEDSSYVLNELIVEDLATKDALISLLTDKYSSESVGQIVRQFTSQINKSLLAGGILCPCKQNKYVSMGYASQVSFYPIIRS